jgi:DNA polymerase-1
MAQLLIDADILVYKAIAAVETETEWEPDLWTITTDLNEAHASLDTSISNIITSVTDCDAVFCFTDSENFRKEVNPTYKSNRTKQRKPVGFKAFREQAITRLKGVIKPKLEADDIIGILATRPNADVIIWSEDKDLMQIPGKHLIEGELVVVTKEEGDHLHMMQTLTGDPVDGYTGIPGIGKVKAQAILKDADDPWAAVVAAYEKAGLDEHEALIQARMARILQWTDWDFDRQEAILWTPNK